VEEPADDLIPREEQGERVREVAVDLGLVAERERLASARDVVGELERAGPRVVAVVERVLDLLPDEVAALVVSVVDVQEAGREELEEPMAPGPPRRPRAIRPRRARRFSRLRGGPGARSGCRRRAPRSPPWCARSRRISRAVPPPSSAIDRVAVPRAPTRCGDGPSSSRRYRFAIDLLTRIGDEMEAEGRTPPVFWSNVTLRIPGETREDALKTMRALDLPLRPEERKEEARLRAHAGGRPRRAAAPTRRGGDRGDPSRALAPHPPATAPRLRPPARLASSTRP
jgi:hypothetical protein